MGYTYIVVGQLLRPLEVIGGVVRLFISKSAEGESCNVDGADEGDFAVPAGRVDLTFFFDRCSGLRLEEVF